jgi:Asp-tRNA(Asn)/Glu-tRNA(Gln) amidotransferase A subunit family amidase
LTPQPLLDLPAFELATRLARRELSAEALLRATFERIAERDADIRAFVHLDPPLALAQARALDAGPWRGALHGLPLGVKDLIDTAELPTAYGSAVYAGHRPAADAAVVALCREAGAVLAGKTVSTEFAYFQPGATRNPHHPAHTPGGSSSGSAAAVAAGLLPLALGTQTAGSIIRPAAFCGVVGYKPSWGRVPRAGVKSLSESLDTVGGFGRTVRDVALLGAVLTGDSRLLAPFDADAPRIGLCFTPEGPLADADTQAAWADAVHRLGPATALADVRWPAALADLVALQKAVMAFEMARSLSHERLQHRARLSTRLLALLDEGMAITGATHAENLAQVVQAQQQATSLFDDCDVLLAPSAIGEAPAGLDATGDPVFCRGWTLLGLPCVHLPFARGRRGLPVGLQLVGRQGDDARLLAAADWCLSRLL